MDSEGVGVVCVKIVYCFFLLLSVAYLDAVQFSSIQKNFNHSTKGNFVVVMADS